MSQGHVSSLERCALVGILWSEINDEPLAIRAAQETFDPFRSHPVYYERWITLPFSKRAVSGNKHEYPCVAKNAVELTNFAMKTETGKTLAVGENRTTLTWPTMDPTVLRRSPQQGGRNAGHVFGRPGHDAAQIGPRRRRERDAEQVRESPAPTEGFYASVLFVFVSSPTTRTIACGGAGAHASARGAKRRWSMKMVLLDIYVHNGRQCFEVWAPNVRQEHPSRNAWHGWYLASNANIQSGTAPFA